MYWWLRSIPKNLSSAQASSGWKITDVGLLIETNGNALNMYMNKYYDYTKFGDDLVVKINE